MIRWPLFRRKFVTFRIGQFNKLHDISELIELPHMAIYHCLDRFQMLDNRSDMGPALDNPFINMNQYKMFICNIIMPPKDPEPTDICEYTLTKMILTNAGVMQKLQDFKRRMTPRVMWTDDCYIWYINGVEAFRTSYGLGVSQVPEQLRVSLCLPNTAVENMTRTKDQSGEYVVDYVRIYQPAE